MTNYELLRDALLTIGASFGDSLSPRGVPTYLLTDGIFFIGKKRVRNIISLHGKDSEIRDSFAFDENGEYIARYISDHYTMI